jgi:hypothetical protein
LLRYWLWDRDDSLCGGGLGGGCAWQRSGLWSALRGLLGEFATYTLLEKFAACDCLSGDTSSFGRRSAGRIGRLSLRGVDLSTLVDIIVL